MSKSRARLAADWFAKLRQNAVTQEVEHTDVMAAEAEALEAKADAADAAAAATAPTDYATSAQGALADTALQPTDDGSSLTGVLRKGPDIGAGANLNTYTTDGYYHQNANSSAGSGTNYPVSLAGMLTVTSDGSMVYQKYQTYNGTGTYQRTKYTSTWYAWDKVFDSGNQTYGAGAVGTYALVGRYSSTAHNVGDTVAGSSLWTWEAYSSSNRSSGHTFSWAGVSHAHGFAGTWRWVSAGNLSSTRSRMGLAVRIS